MCAYYLYMHANIQQKTTLCVCSLEIPDFDFVDSKQLDVLSFQVRHKSGHAELERLFKRRIQRNRG